MKKFVITVEFIGRNRETFDAKVSRVPVAGDLLALDGGDSAAATVETVFLAIDPKPGDPDAIVRVRW